MIRPKDPEQLINRILYNYLKPKLKDNRFKVCKKEIKLLIMIAQHAGGDLEKKLLIQNKDIIRAHKDACDAQALFDLLNYLTETYSLTSQLLDENKDRKKNVIYILADHIAHCFSDDGTQIAPLSLFIDSNCGSDLVTTINEDGHFKAEIAQVKASKYHILLHPGSNAMLSVSSSVLI